MRKLNSLQTPEPTTKLTVDEETAEKEPQFLEVSINLSARIRKEFVNNTEAGVGLWQGAALALLVVVLFIFGMIGFFLWLQN